MRNTQRLRIVACLLTVATLLPLSACMTNDPQSNDGEETTVTATNPAETDPSETTPEETQSSDETQPQDKEPAETEPGEVTTPTDGETAGILMTDYHCADYTDLTENDLAKLQGDGATLTVNGVDGGEKGGKTNLTITFCSEPNFETSFEIEVNGEVQYRFTNSGGSNWFEMKKKTCKITLKAGAENVIRIITPIGKISHIATLTVGDVNSNDLAVKEVNKNNLTYNFMDGNPPNSEASGGKTYAKLGISDTVTLTGVDGGEHGGLCKAYVRTTTQPGVSTALRITVNDNRSVVVRVSDISQNWFQFFNSVFETFLNPGTTNTVSVQVIEGGITHMDILAIGATDGSTENPYAAVAGEEVGMENATINGAVAFLQDNRMLSSDATVKANCITILTRITGTESQATSIYNAVCSTENPSQRQCLAMLLRAMGYNDASADTAMQQAQVLGIVGNVPTGSYGDVLPDNETLAAYVYNALSAKCADGKKLADKCEVTLPSSEVYEVKLVAQESTSQVNGNNATVVSKDGISTVSTVDRYRRFAMTAEVKADTLNAFVMGFRVNSSSHSIYDSGIWLKFANQNVEMTSNGHTVYMEVPMGLFNVTEGVTLKAVDNGESINLYAVVENALVPFIEIRFEDGYAIGYVRGHLIHGLKADHIADSGHIAFAANNGTVTYSNITISAPDAVQNLNTEYPEVAEGQPFEITETFDHSLYDYNMFFGTGGGLAVRDGKLVYSANGRENIFSTVMRVENGVIEADVLPGSGEMQFQLGASSNMSEGYYYCGLRFTVKSGTVELYHDTGNADEEATMDTLIRTHSFNVSKGYSVRLADVDGEITFSMKELDDDQYTLILRIIRKDTYLSVLDKGNVNEEAHFDKLQRQFGYLRIVSTANATVDNVRISGKGYLPYEQMEINPAPTPDADELLEADNVETLVGVGYIPYFTRYRVNGVNATRPAVEDLLPGVIEASKLRGQERTEALNKLYWGYAWWATPAQGMYCGRDFWAAKNNLQMIAEAGIDFIYIDNTNFNGGCTPDEVMNDLEVILEAALELEAEGKPCPKICFWNNVRNEAGWERGGYEDTAREIWQVFISNPKYKNLWVYYHGKPLMMYTFGQPMPYLGMSDVAEIREMWTASNINNTWSFHQDPPEMANRGGLDAEGNLEQINVLPYGKTTFNGNISSLENLVANGTGGREGGLYYKKYWEKAFEERPKFVTLWAYNHWDVSFRQPAQDGSVYWGDNFSQEYSGGLEPIAGNFVYKGIEYPGDSYYEWTKEYIRAYKAGEDMPENLYVKVD